MPRRGKIVGKREETTVQRRRKVAATAAANGIFLRSVVERVHGGIEGKARKLEANEGVGEAPLKTATYREVVDDRQRLLDILPQDIRRAVHALPDASSLVEVVLDLGRPPEARTEKGFTPLLPRDVTADDLAHVVSRVGSF